MRYDLEFNVVSQLSSAGLTELADIFYSTDGDLLTPAQWDTKDLISSAQQTAGAIDTSRYNDMKDVPSWIYASGIASSEALEIARVISRNNMIVPLFKAGAVFFNKYKFQWSNNTIRKEVQFDGTLGLYKAEVDGDIDTSSMSAFTLRFKYPGYVSYEKEWEYVEFIEDTDLTLRENLDITFSSATDDHNITVVIGDDTSYAYLSGVKITASSLEIGTAFASKGSLMALGEYPIDSNTFTIDGFDGSQGEFSSFTSTIAFNNTTVSDFDVLVNYEVTPVLTYSQHSRSSVGEVVYSHANIIPGTIGFKNGVIALHNIGSAGGTVQTDQGNNIVIPVEISLDVDKTETSVLDSVKCTATLGGLDSMPVKDAMIRFELLSVNDDVKFIESGSTVHNVTTNINGQCTANAFIDRSRFGWYLQKQWVSGNKIYVPFDINTDQKDEVYIYFITSDDPILGKLGAKSYEEALNERYNSEESLETYELDGRKVAYVKMMNRQTGGAEVVYSSFVKPVSVLRDQAFNTDFKNLFIENSSQDIISFSDSFPDHMSMMLDTPVNSYDALSLGYADGIIPNNTLDIYRATTTMGSIIEFDQAIPAYDNIIGYWLITGSSADVKVKATFNDTTSFIHLESNEIGLTTSNYVQSEYEFILVDSETANDNSTLSSFGYYTVSEYLENPYKQSACTYTCKYSDPINRKCSFENNVYQDYYANDGDSGICIKPASDGSLPEDQRCPIKTQQYLLDSSGNPLPQQEIVDDTVILDIYTWTDQADYLANAGKEPHIALYDGDIDQATLDSLATPLYQDNPNYEDNAWGFINPFIMHAQ